MTGPGKVSPHLSKAIFLLAFCGYIVPLMLPAIVPDIARELQVDISSLGFVVGLQFAVASCVPLLVAPIARRIGHKNVALTATLLAAISIAAMGMSRSLDSFVAAATAAAFSYGSMLFFSLSAVRMHVPEQDRPRNAGLITSSLFLASIVGVPIGIVVSQSGVSSWRAAFLMVAFVCLIASALWYLAVPKTGASDSMNGTSPQIGILRSRPLVAYLVTVFLIRAGAGMYLTYIPAYVVLGRGLETIDLVWTYSGGGLAGFFASMKAGRLIETIGSARTIAYASSVLCLAVYFIAFFPADKRSIFLVVLIASILYALGESFRMTGLHAIAIDKAGSSNNAYLGWFTFVLSSGYAAGALLGGVVLRSTVHGDAAATIATNYPWLACAAIVLWVLTAVWIWQTRARNA